MKLTKEMVVKGAQFRKTIQVRQYGNAEVEIRPLTDLELSMILEKTGVSLDPQNIQSPAMTKVLVEACRYGIVDPELRSAVDQLSLGAAFAIGSEILSLSLVTSDEILAFFAQ